MDKAWIFVLGAQDPEMREIQKVVSRVGGRYLHAAKDGVRCSPKTAYEANGVVVAEKHGYARAAILRPKEPAVFVECGLADRQPAVRVDHHQVGDPGYDKPPHRYMEGSSLGQVLRLLEVEPSETQRLLAAGDHCLTAAYQGECPGVSPEELLFLRASWRAKVTGRSLHDVTEGILDAASLVRRRFDSESGVSLFLDPTAVPPDLAEGAAYAGLPIRYRDYFRDGELKEMLKGGSPDQIEGFMRGHEAAGRHVYGNAYRGYAGAYIA